MRTSRRIAIIGAGRVGATLGRVLVEAGHRVDTVVSRTKRSAQRAVGFIGAGQPVAIGRLQKISADILLIAVSDDRIGATVQSLLKMDVAAKVALHTSGSRTSAELAPLRAAGLSVASCHPVQTFGEPAIAIESVRHAVFTIEGDASAVRAAKQMVRSIGALPIQIRQGSKSLYHAALVLASNHLAALAAEALELLKKTGLNERDARRLLFPLLRGTVENLQRLTPARALTGPFVRGDLQTIRKNLEAIEKVSRAAAATYRVLGLHVLRLAEEAGLSPAKAREIAKLIQ